MSRYLCHGCFFFLRYKGFFDIRRSEKKMFFLNTKSLFGMQNAFWAVGPPPPPFPCPLHPPPHLPSSSCNTLSESPPPPPPPQKIHYWYRVTFVCSTSSTTFSRKTLTISNLIWRFALQSVYVQTLHLERSQRKGSLKVKMSYEIKRLENRRIQKKRTKYHLGRDNPYLFKSILPFDNAKKNTFPRMGNKRFRADRNFGRAAKRHVEWLTFSCK